MAKSTVKKTPKPKRKPTKTIKKTSPKPAKTIKKNSPKPVKTIKKTIKPVKKPKPVKTIKTKPKKQPKQQIDCGPCRLKSKINQSNRIFKYI